MYDLKTGQVEKHRGRPARRPKGIPPPCKQCPKGGPDEFSDLLPQNLECMQHYLECEATGSFPDDPMVKRHAALLKMVRDHADKYQRKEELTASIVNQYTAQVMAMASKAKG